jgi:hypothetical protein
MVGSEFEQVGQAFLPVLGFSGLESQKIFHMSFDSEFNLQVQQLN